MCVFLSFFLFFSSPEIFFLGSSVIPFVWPFCQSKQVERTPSMDDEELFEGKYDENILNVD